MERTAASGRASSGNDPKIAWLPITSATSSAVTVQAARSTCSGCSRRIR
jgi:hypothetical protein